jgi:hypothetical protein
MNSLPEAFVEWLRERATRDNLLLVLQQKVEENERLKDELRKERKLFWSLTSRANRLQYDLDVAQDQLSSLSREFDEKLLFVKFLQSKQDGYTKEIARLSSVSLGSFPPKDIGWGLKVTGLLSFCIQGFSITEDGGRFWLRARYNAFNADGLDGEPMTISNGCLLNPSRLYSESYMRERAMVSIRSFLDHELKEGFRSDSFVPYFDPHPNNF